jgi:diaminohydroxyphosphoribosylaminopyrimidine deaminase/5-amino-6-(5-phosphoribosylamino)uracil reductase
MAASFDVQMMARAVQLARRGIYSSRPNPTVGCVLVGDNAIVGEGYTQPAGGNHGEIEALEHCDNPRGTTAYVTLEPCSHHGKTGPCADALIEAGIAECFVAMRDPNPAVSGQGIAKLQQAGIEVNEGLLETEALAINAGFFQRMLTGKPKVRIKLAASLDGRTAMASGESQWITGPAARADVQKWRARSDAIVTGVDTVIADNPAMTVRDESLDIRQQPLRVIVDSSRRTPPDAKILAEPGATLVVHNLARGPEGVGEIVDNFPAELAYLPGADGRVDLTALVRLLGERQCNDILVECGSRLAGAFVAADLADEIILYQAAVLMGSEGRPLLDLPIHNMADKRQLQIVESRQIGDDIRMIIKINKGA